MNKILITFGAGEKNFYEASERLVNQGKELNIFDEIISFSDKDLHLCTFKMPIIFDNFAKGEIINI